MMTYNKMRSKKFMFIIDLINQKSRTKNKDKTNKI